MIGINHLFAGPETRRYGVAIHPVDEEMPEPGGGGVPQLCNVSSVSAQGKNATGEWIGNIARAIE